MLSISSRGPQCCCRSPGPHEAALSHKGNLWDVAVPLLQHCELQECGYCNASASYIESEHTAGQFAGNWLVLSAAVWGPSPPSMFHAGFPESPG